LDWDKDWGRCPLIMLRLRRYGEMGRCGELDVTGLELRPRVARDLQLAAVLLQTGGSRGKN
jgi:hypothetical protein